jgi:hypothetical protein
MLRQVVTSVAILGATLTAQSPSAAPKNDYADGANWLCRPGRADACTVDLSSTVIAGNGALTRETWKANPDALIDCFYVYPTVSRDTTPNSDMIPGPEEKNVVLNQFARFGSQCKMYAPMYRQFTMTALRAMTAGAPSRADMTLGYNDVRDAWNYYLEHDNHGRGIVLIGHSQGSSVLVQLIRNEIDGKPAMARLVSAMLMGTTLQVPAGKDVGGTFQHIPLCHSATQVACVITYSSFRADAPPPPNARFGRGAGTATVAACTNPAALGGGSGELHSYFPSGPSAAASTMSDARNAWTTPAQPIATPFVSLPGFLTAECISTGRNVYLAITVHADPSGPRTSRLTGDVIVAGQIQPDWGLHLIDVNEAMGNLVGIAGTQAKAFVTGKPN